MLLYINSTCSDKNKVICIVILDEVKKYIHKNICTLVFYHNVNTFLEIGFCGFNGINYIVIILILKYVYLVWNKV